MTRQRPRTKRPGFAVLLLVGSSAFVATMLFGTFGARPTGPLAPWLADDEDPADDGEQGAADTTVWRDLLAAHGSFTGPEVRMAFAASRDSLALGAAPAGETAVAAADPRWIGEDPPRLVLGVVVVSTAAQRAVLGGRVVGVGDRVGEARVAAIEPGKVTVLWRDRLLTYDLELDVPREFRAELARRQQGQSRADGAPAQETSMEVGK